MDLFSASVGIAVAAGTTIHAIANLVNRIQDGPQHVKELSDDIQHLESFLHHAEEVLRVDGVSDSVVSGTANSLIRTIQALNHELQQISHKFKGKDPSAKDEIQRLKWFFSEQKCRKIQARITYYRGELSRSIELMNLWVHLNLLSPRVSN